MSSFPIPERTPTPGPYIEETVPAPVTDLRDYREVHLLDLVSPEEPIAAARPFHEDWKRVEAARNNEAAFESLLLDFQSLIRLWASAYFIAGGDSDDVMQEAMFGFYKAVRDYDGSNSSFRSFAELCAKRQVITALKTATRFKHEPINQYVSFSQTPAGAESDDMTIGEAIPDPGRLPEELVIGKESFGGLLDILANDLSYLEYSVVRMYIEGDSYEAMAEELFTDLKTIDNALQRVKRKILDYQESRS